eukprot:scaffold213235_cov66-Cyclotella_meneghiniana.AAC.1
MSEQWAKYFASTSSASAVCKSASRPASAFSFFGASLSAWELAGDMIAGESDSTRSQRRAASVFYHGGWGCSWEGCERSVSCPRCWGFLSPN